MNNLDTNSHSINQFNIDCQDERLSQTLFSISNGNIGLKSSLIDDEYVSSPRIFLKKFYDRTFAVNSELVNLNNADEIIDISTLN